MSDAAVRDPAAGAGAHQHATVPVVAFTVRGEPRDAAPESAEAARGPGRDYTVVYDGDCKVCTRLASLLRRMDTRHRFEVVTSQTPSVRARFPWIPASAYLESIQVVARDGRTWQGAAALEAIIDALPKGKFFSWIFSIPFVRPLAERFYRWFARNRYRLGCGAHCSYRGQLKVDYKD